MRVGDFADRYGTRTLFLGVANGSGDFAGDIRGTGGGPNDVPDAAAIDVVKKTRSSQTTGDECPRPGISVFHAMFSVADQVVEYVPSATPRPPGPRH